MAAPPALPLSPEERRQLAVLFVVVLSVYFATFTGITSSNDGSHYALVRALVERRSFEISPYLELAENQDYASGPNGRYTDRPPGTALWTAPFYAVANFLPAPSVELPSKHDRGNPRLLGVALAAALASSGAVALFWLLLRRHFGASLFASGIAAVALAFGTTTWKYGSVLYSHGLSALCVLASLWLALRLARDWRRNEAVALGLALGAGVLVEYTNLLFVAIVLVYLLARGRAPLQLCWVVAGGVLPAGFLAYYDWVNFGSPLLLSTFQVDVERWPNAAGMASTFATPLAEGLVGMLWWGRDNQGLFLLSPVAILGLLGVPAFVRARRGEAVLVLGTFVVFLLLFSKSTFFNPLTNDGRYLVPFLALWLVPAAFWVDRALCACRSENTRLAATLVLGGLLFLSIRNAFMHSPSRGTTT